MSFRCRPLAVAALGALALLSLSQPSFADRKTNNTLIGAGVGGVGGALLSNGDPLATVGGAAAGGLIGNVATSDHHHHDHDDDRERYHRDGRHYHGDHGYDRHDRGDYGHRGRW